MDLWSKSVDCGGLKILGSRTCMDLAVIVSTIECVSFGMLVENHADSISGPQSTFKNHVWPSVQK